MKERTGCRGRSRDFISGEGEKKEGVGGGVGIVEYVVVVPSHLAKSQSEGEIKDAGCSESPRAFSVALPVAGPPRSP